MTTARSAAHNRLRRAPFRRVFTATTAAAILLTASFTIAPVAPASAADVIRVGDAASLATAFTGGGSIVLGGSFAVTKEVIAVPVGKSVTLDLNGFTLTVTAKKDQAAVLVPAGASLTIKDLPGGGSLKAAASYTGAGIGGTYGIQSGNIEIAGGTVTAIGGDNGAGIGGGPIPNGGVSGNIKISGGTVIATSGTNGAGIGGSNMSTGGNIEISGGVVSATGGGRGPGIGGGAAKANGNIRISGGTVTANGGQSGSGIGGGDGGTGGDIRISGGTVTANGGLYAAGIGGGKSKAGGKVEITGGIVNAAGGNSGAGIGGGQGAGGGNIGIAAGTVNATGGGDAAGMGGGFEGSGANIKIDGGNVNVAASASSPNVVIGAGLGGAAFGSLANTGVLTIAAGSTFVIPVGTTVRNEGTITADGSIVNRGRIANVGTGQIARVENVTGNSYTVTFVDAKSASPTRNDQRVFASSLAAAEIALPTPVVPGHTFTGWFTKATGGTIWNAATAIAGDLTLHARWIADIQTISFDSNGGSAVAAVRPDYGTTIMAPNVPTKTGHTFVGWFNGGSAWDFTTAVTGDMTLVAQWTLDTHRITFDTHGGNTVEEVTTNYETAVPVPAVPTFAGHTFVGWFNGGSAWDFTTAVTGDMTLVAQWTLDTYKVTFDTHGGNAIAEVTTNYGTAVAAPAVPTFAGHTFAGWFNGATEWDFAAQVTGDMTLVVHWTLDTHKVTFDTRGGSAIAPVVADFGTAIQAPAAPTRTGYTFTGWFQDADLTAAFDFISMITADTDLHAGWTKNVVVPPADNAAIPPATSPAADNPVPDPPAPPSGELSSTGAAGLTGGLFVVLALLLAGTTLVLTRKRAKRS